MRSGTSSLPVDREIAGDSIRARDTMPTPDHAVFLIESYAVEEPLAPVMRPAGSL